MLRRVGAFSASRLASMSVLINQLDGAPPLVEGDGPVQSYRDEFHHPPVSAEMQKKFGPYGKYVNPSFTTVDVSSEVKLNSYPEGCPKGRLEWSGQTDLEKFDASFFDEAFFRKHILKPPVPESKEDKNRVVDYALNGVMTGLLILAARYMVAPLWWIGQPRMTQVAESNIECEVGVLEPKECKTIVWRGKPIFVYERSSAQLKQVRAVPLSSLKHPETDEERCPDPAHGSTLVCIGLCTHLGCIPTPNEGNFNGFFCACHGSHYDASARIRQGPAPLNLEVPPYEWISDGVIFLGNKQ